MFDKLPIDLQKMVYKYVFDSVIEDLKMKTIDIYNCNFNSHPPEIPEDDFYKYYITSCIDCEINWVSAWEIFWYDHMTHELLLDLENLRCINCK